MVPISAGVIACATAMSDGTGDSTSSLRITLWSASGFHTGIIFLLLRVLVRSKCFALVDLRRREFARTVSSREYRPKYSGPCESLVALPHKNDRVGRGCGLAVAECESYHILIDCSRVYIGLACCLAAFSREKWGSAKRRVQLALWQSQTRATRSCA